MKLETISTDDLPLYESIYCDPCMMAQLGGVFPKERVPQILENALGYVESGRGMVFKVIPEDETSCAAGTVCIYRSSWKGRRINELGWMVLPQFQGRGLASEAVRAMLEKARAEKWCYTVHAFCATTNEPSNAICRKLGFSKVEECDLTYADRVLRGNHWRLDMRRAATA